MYVVYIYVHGSAGPTLYMFESLSPYIHLSYSFSREKNQGTKQSTILHTRGARWLGQSLLNLPWTNMCCRILLGVVTKMFE